MAVSTSYIQIHHPLVLSAEKVVKKGCRFASHVWNKQFDLVLSVGTLVITTCLLASKIFQKMPAILPRLSMVFYNYFGIIWLKYQWPELVKSCRDFSRAFQVKNLEPIVATAVQIFIKATVVLLTCSIFGAATIAALGFPEVMCIFYLVTRPFAITSLVLTILSDVRNYFVNKKLLQQMDRIENTIGGGKTIGTVVDVFVGYLFSKNPQKEKVANKEVLSLGTKLVQQLNYANIRTFKETMTERKEKGESPSKIQLFNVIRKNLTEKQESTLNNLTLTALGYVAMGISRIFPESVIDFVVRLVMSILYTDDLINQKLHDYDSRCLLMKKEIGKE